MTDTHKTYRLYISHSWTYNLEACQKKIQFFDQAGLHYEFLEAFHDAPTHSGNTEDVYTLHMENKIKACDCLLVLAGTEEEQNHWTCKEIDLAKLHGKPIIAIEPWMPTRTLPVLKSKADIIVKWHGKLITDAIRTFA